VDYYAKTIHSYDPPDHRAWGYRRSSSWLWGAVFGALNTMSSAVAERGREIATMRALGFSTLNVLLSFLFEALLISLVGGILAASSSFH